MKLPSLLRDHLLDGQIPWLTQNPDRLSISVEKGRVLWRTGSLSHRQSYDLVVELDELPEDLDPSLILTRLIAFFDAHQDPQPTGGHPLTFEVFPLSNSTTTAVFTLALDETVVVSADGQIDVCPT